MINKLVVKYFQSHKKTVLRFSPGVNGIIGKPNSGKTALIRAILLLKNNRPSGYDFHNDSTTKPVEVHIKPDNQPLLKFKKKESKASYSIGKTKFKSVGQKVPEEITHALNLSDINFGLQLGFPFLILSTPPEIARVINKATESEVITKCIKETNERLSKLKSKKKSLESTIDDNESILIPYKKLDDIKPILDKATRIDEKVEAKLNSIEKILEIKQRMTQAETAIKSESRALKAKKLVKQSEKIFSQMETIAVQITLLYKIEQLNDSLNISYKQRSQHIDQYTKELKRSKVCPTCYSPINKRTINFIKEGFPK